MQRNILWVDDEVDLLKAHVISLKEGLPCHAGDERRGRYDLVKQRTFDAASDERCRAWTASACFSS
jgi:hypothetical protein